MDSLLEWIHSFVCEYCRAKFGSYDGLKRHLRNNPSHDI